MHIRNLIWQFSQGSTLYQYITNSTTKAFWFSKKTFQLSICKLCLSSDFFEFLINEYLLLFCRSWSYKSNLALFLIALCIWSITCLHHVFHGIHCATSWIFHSYLKQVLQDLLAEKISSLSNMFSLKYINNLKIVSLW